MQSKCVLLIMALCNICTFAHATETTIEWKVEHPFRFIKSDQTPQPFELPAGTSISKFIESYINQNMQNSPLPINDTYWVRDSRVNERIPKEYIFPPTVRVVAKLLDVVGSCTWIFHNSSETISCDKPYSLDAPTQFGQKDSELRVLLPDGNTITQNIKVRDRLILGLGDSFGSGESNPDHPVVMSEEGLRNLASSNSDRITTGRWMLEGRNWVKTNAEWLDKECHRSLFSQHILAGMALSNRDPHESVTLLPLACSGAEILDGLLTKQEKPPGGDKRVKSPNEVNDSQLNAAVKYLCDGEVISMKKQFYKGFNKNIKRQPITENLYQCRGSLRQPDAILLSVGGNDVGFASLINWAMLPRGGRNIFGMIAVSITNKAAPPICPVDNNTSVCKRNLPLGADRVRDWLPSYYAYLERELESANIVNPASNKVFLTSYPNSIYLEDGKTVCDKDRSKDASEQARTLLPRFFWTQKWDIQINKDEMNAIDIGVFQPLKRAMKRATEVHNWQFIDDYTDSILSHGICAGYTRDDPNIPIFPHIRNGTWYPQLPIAYKAYDYTRTRWFRNTNDSIMFQTDDTGGRINGTFHPDVRSHAVIAESLYKAVDKLWSGIDTHSKD